MVHNLGLRSAFDAGVASIHGMLWIPLHFGDLAVTHMSQHTTFNMTTLAHTPDDFIHCFTPFRYRVPVKNFIWCSVFYLAFAGVFQPEKYKPAHG
jgi:hypothetical protein